MIPIDFPEDDVTSVTSNISGVLGALGAEALGLSKWLVFFGCLLKELRAVIANMTEWMDNSSPPWAAYCALMACRLVALDKRPGVCLVGIRETCSALNYVGHRSCVCGASVGERKYEKYLDMADLDRKKGSGRKPIEEPNT